MEHLKAVLRETFAANFVSYYRAHASHINIVGRNFYSDHKLLQKIYEYFQGNIDILGEKLRTIRAKAPEDIAAITTLSSIMDFPVSGTADEMLEFVEDSIETMIDQYHNLNDAAEAVNYVDISNYAQDQIGQLAKFRWMLESTLESEEDDTEDQ